MAEYYTVLRRAIAGIDPNVPETRRGVYDKARNALIGQLKAVDPPLTTAEISRQRLELEEAIRRVEREAASGAAAAPAANRAPPAPQRAAEPSVSMPPVHEYEPPDPAAQPSPQEVFRRAIQDAGMRGSTPPPPAARYDAGPDLRGAPPPRAPTPHAEGPERNALPVRADAGRYTVPDYRRRQPPQDGYRVPHNVEPEPYDQEPEPRLAPEYDQDWERQQAPPVDRRERAMAAAGPAPSRGRGYAEPVEEEPPARKPRRSRLGGIVLTVLILAVIGGLGALAWSQRAVITDLIAGLESGSGGAGTAEQPILPPPAEEPGAVATADSGKNTDRLLPGEAPPAGSEMRVVGDADGGETADTGPAMAAAPVPASADATTGTGGPQKAILYEEPVDGAAADATVTSVDAEVSWRFVGDGPNGPEVEASLDVPERNMTIRFSLHKNADDTLPASHLVEVVVDTPADFPGKAIGSIPRIVLKPTEGARGQPLVGAAAKVADGFFWIALSAAEADIASNLSLMRERNWIDLPFVYENGQRAILTFEKGPDGESAFQQAFAAWGAG
jgi:hypothetical protein